MSPPVSVPNVSVIVNTYNRAASLGQTLQAMTMLDYPSFEVVVVNGPSTDDTESVLAEFAGRIKVGHCPERNLSASRNAGIAMAAGDILAFIDDDAYPDPGWLGPLVAGYDDDEVASVGGPVYNHTGAELQARWCITSKFGMGWNAVEGPNPTRYLNTPGTGLFAYPLGTNVSFRRDLLVEIGGFDEEYEYYFDEADLCCRLVDRGYLVRAVDDGFVFHKFLPSDVRGETRKTTHRFLVVKNTVYFALRHGPASGSFFDVCKGLLEFVEDQRRDLRWCIEAGLLDQSDAERFESELPDAFNLGLERFCANAPKTRAPGWFAERAIPFRPFPTTRANEDKLHVCVLAREPASVRDLADGLGALGHVVRLITPGRGHDRVDLEDGVWVHRVTVAPGARPPGVDVPAAAWSESAAMLRELRRVDAHRPVDVVHAPRSPVDAVAVLVDGGFTTVVGPGDLQSSWAPRATSVWPGDGEPNRVYDTLLGRDTSDRPLAAFAAPHGARG